MLRQYRKPDDIYDYGRMVQAYNLSMKAVASALDDLSFDEAVIDKIVGKGKYNTRESDNFIVRGQQQTKAAYGNMEGLFGAFFPVHLPELQMSKKAPELLGKAGCTLQTTIDGHVVSFPLDKVKFDFIPVSDRDKTDGKIITKGEIQGIDAEGRAYKLPDATVLVEERAWIKKDGSFAYHIVDAKGKALDDEAAVIMLWSSVGAKGFKKFNIPFDEDPTRVSEDARRFRTLAYPGVDDDFTAEQAMIGWMNSFKKNNGIDLMPAFNGYVQQSHDLLQNNPNLLQSLALAKELIGMAAEEALMPFDLKKGKERNSFKFLASQGNGIHRMLNMLDVTLPDVTQEPIFDACKKQFTTNADDTKQRITMRMAHIIHGSHHTHQCIEQADVFSPLWLKGEGNQLRSQETLKAYFPHLPVALFAEPYGASVVQAVMGDTLEADARKEVARHLRDMAHFIDRVIKDKSWLQTEVVTQSDVTTFASSLYQTSTLLKNLNTDVNFKKSRSKNNLKKTGDAVRNILDSFDGYFTESMRENPLSHEWQNTMRATFHGFADVVQSDVVNNDYEKWMDLYRTVSQGIAKVDGIDTTPPMHVISKKEHAGVMEERVRQR